MTVDADEDVARLDVAVHDEVGVCVGDRLEHVEKQAQARLHAERVLVAVAVDGLPIDVLEHEVRLAIRGDTGVGEAGDVRMRQPREDASFAPEALFARAPHDRDVQQLDRRAPDEPAVAALGQPHASHPALADQG